MIYYNLCLSFLRFTHDTQHFPGLPCTIVKDADSNDDCGLVVEDFGTAAKVHFFGMKVMYGEHIYIYHPVIKRGNCLFSFMSFPAN